MLFVTNFFGSLYWPAPSIVRLAVRLFGYTPVISNYIGLLASCVAVIMIFLICELISTHVTASIGACLVFASTPIFAIYGMGSYAEPTSNACISVSLFCYMRYLYAKHDKRFPEFMNWCAFTLTLVLAVLIKRENIIMAIVLPLVSFGLIAFHSEPAVIDGKKLRWAFLGCVIALVFSTVELELARNVISETGEYAQFPFALSNARTLLPVFLMSFISLKWYSLTFFFVLAGLADASRRKSLALFPVFLLASYMILYTTHVRNYYLLHGAVPSPTEAFRPSMNFMSLWSILAGLGIEAGTRFSGILSVPRKLCGIAVVCGYICVSYLATANLQRKSQSAEFVSRINPALVASELATQLRGPRTYIVTVEPLVVQMFAPQTMNVLALRLVNYRLLTKLARDDPYATLLFLKQATYENQLASERYKAQLKCLEPLEREKLYSDSTFSVVRLSFPPDHQPEPESQLTR